MAKEPSIEEAVERARRAQENRINAVRDVAVARQDLTDVREQTARELAELQARIAEQIREAERDDVRAFNAALAAGWSVDELRKIGFAEPEKKVRARKRATRRQTTGAASATAPAEAIGDGRDAAHLQPTGV